MGRRKNPNPLPPHRPLKPIDWDYVDELIEAGANGMQIAGACKMHHNTFYERFQIEKGTAFTEYRSSREPGGQAVVLYEQMKSVRKGNVQMLIHLGKERCGQTKGNENATSENRNAVVYEQSRQEMESPLHSRATVLTDLETEPHLPHQECTGEKGSVPNELGTEDTLGGETQL